ncbi:MAG: hypothetical protein U5K71_05795 [Gracilimonas sp.]|nr:hypothetical protein [Gracilimonas sp.]
MQGNNLIASQVEAAVEAQTFESSDVTTLDNTEFLFTTPDHYVELQSGDLQVSEIVNNIDITVEQYVDLFSGNSLAPLMEPAIHWLSITTVLLRSQETVQLLPEALI